MNGLVQIVVLRFIAMNADGFEGFQPKDPTREELLLLADHYAAMASALDRLDPPGGIAAWHDGNVHLWELGAEMGILQAQGLSPPVATSTVVPAEKDPWAEHEDARQHALAACPELAGLFPPLADATPAATPTA